MQISCDKLPDYFASATFPLRLFSEKTCILLRSISRGEAHRLAMAGAVVGIGSPSYLRYLRMTHTVRSLRGVIERQRLKEGVGFRCEDNYTFEKEPTSSGWLWRHHRKHCAAFGVPIIAGKIPADFPLEQKQHARTTR